MKVLNNKGYTLVELMLSMAIFLVIFGEIAAFMQSAQRFYLKGAFEVNLQTEAQQVVQQLEEFFIDTQIEVSVNNAVDVSVGPVRGGAPTNYRTDAADYYNVNVGEKFTAKWNDEITYTFELLESTSSDYTTALADTATKTSGFDTYGNLWLTKTDSTGTYNHLMGEYVNNIMIDASSLDDTSRLIVSVSMNNGRSAYHTDKDVYLRNDIGKNMSKPKVSDDDGDYDLNILRCKTYNLNDICGTGYKFDWEDSSANGANYYLNTATGTLACSGLNNKDDAFGPIVIIGKADSGIESENIKVLVHTDKLEVGTNNVGFFHPLLHSASPTLRKDYVPVFGISLEENSIESYSVSFKFANNDGLNHPDMVTQTVTTIPIKAGIDTSGTKVGSAESVKDVAGHGTSSMFQLGEHCLSFDPEDNVIICYIDGYHTNNQNADVIKNYYEDLCYLKTNKGSQFENIHFDCSIKFKGRSNAVTFKIYARPVYNFGGTTDYGLAYWTVTQSPN